MSTSLFKVAAVQMDSSSHKTDNLRAAAAAIDEAASAGAQVICLPEVMNCLVSSGQPNQPEPIGGPTTHLLVEKAQEHGVYIQGGTLSECVEGQARTYNTAILVSPEGEILTRYRKMHLFDVSLPSGSSPTESKHVLPGCELSVVDTLLGTWGIAICYDLRFPEQFRLMALAGAQVIFVPANFTQQTGRDHWEVLVRARAIENNCYVVATNQCGVKPEFTAFGNSMIVDPWGSVLVRASSDEQEIIYADIDLDRVKEVRAQLSTLDNRRPDIYDLHLI